MDHQEKMDLCNKVAKKLADEGKLIEGGFAAMKIMSIPADASDAQVRDMRVAFFAGAQHLFGSLMGIMEAGNEATDNDLSRMDQISNELDNFITEYKKSRRAN
jgi:hypothetical protein